jgi:hypothetical protein
MMKLLDIDGVTIARGIVTERTEEEPVTTTLTLVAPSGFVDSAHFYPAESITITNTAGLLALRDLLEEMLKLYNERTPSE